MSQGVFQPIGQKRLTNIAVIRIKKHGKRFEIAAYKNKVLNWRNGIEKDIDEVLQTTAIFSNVSKGILAKREDLLLVFGTDDEKVICHKILAEGDLQVSDKERKVELDTLFRDVASVLSEKCINPETNRPYTISMLERALKDVHFNVDPKRAAKTQALEALPLLQERFPIERARMRLRIQIPFNGKDELMDLLNQRQAKIEEQDIAGGTALVITCLVDPGAFRAAHSLVQGNNGRLEVVSLAATAEESDVRTGIEALSLGGGGGGQQQHPMASHVMNLDEPTTTTTATTAVAPDTSAAAPAPVPRPAMRATRQDQDLSERTILYPRGPIADLPEEHASRKERFAELDVLQPGWTVELSTRSGGGAVDATLFSPDGQKVGAFAAARRMALQASKAG